jgi:hypothetical protein
MNTVAPAAAAAASTNDQTLAIVALVISTLSAIAAAGVVWQTWRYHPRPAWIPSLEEEPIWDDDYNMVGGYIAFAISNRGSLEAADVIIWAGKSKPHKRDNHAMVLAETAVVRPGESLEFRVRTPLKHEYGADVDSVTVTWRHHPRPEKVRWKSYKFDEFRWGEYNFQWISKYRRIMAKPPKYQMHFAHRIETWSMPEQPELSDDYAEYEEPDETSNASG